MNLQVGDLLRYFDGSQNHLCVVLESDSVVGKVFWLEDQYGQYLSWVSIYGSFEKVK